MKLFTFGGVEVPDERIRYLLGSGLTVVEQERLQKLMTEPVQGPLLYARLSKREAFTDEADFLAWIRTGMEGL